MSDRQRRVREKIKEEVGVLPKKEKQVKRKKEAEQGSKRSVKNKKRAIKI